MAHPHKAEARSSGRAKMKALTGFAKGGRPHNDEAQDRKLFSKMLHEHGGSSCYSDLQGRKEGGRVNGLKSGGRCDKRARGGAVPRFADGGGVKKGGKGAVNIVIVAGGGHKPGADQGPGGPPPDMGGAGPPPPPAVKPPMPGQMGGAMPGVPMPGMGMPMGGPPGGGAPPPIPGRKHGGRVHAGDGHTSVKHLKEWADRASKNSFKGKMAMAHGGAVMGEGHKYPKISFGGDSGQGRLQRAHEYGGHPLQQPGKNTSPGKNPKPAKQAVTKNK